MSLKYIDIESFCKKGLGSFLTGENPMLLQGTEKGKAWIILQNLCRFLRILNNNNDDDESIQITAEMIQSHVKQIPR